jgi:hypothetical protein
MEHPLLEQLSGLTLEEIQSKISDLNKKLAFAYQTGNQPVINQLQLIMGSYQEAYRKKMDELMPKGDGDKYSNKIDIGK